MQSLKERFILFIENKHGKLNLPYYLDACLDAAIVQPQFQLSTQTSDEEKIFPYIFQKWQDNLEMLRKSHHENDSVVASRYLTVHFQENYKIPYSDILKYQKLLESLKILCEF